MNTLAAMENFDCNGDACSLGLSWERWKRGFLIFVEASNIVKAVKKRATLLHVGGLSLQEIFYNLPGAYIDEDLPENKKVDVFKVALEKLDEYFAPKQSKVYERHIFRLMKQDENEKFEKFLIRLRRQAEKCKFTDINEHLIDQITEKCNSNDLRRKILSSGDGISLETIVAEANSLESVARQMARFDEAKRIPYEVNKLQLRNKISTPCTRCGDTKHSSNDERCPAKSKICRKCGFKGHFEKVCRTRSTKRKNQDGNTFSTVKRTKRENVRSVEDENDVNYIFHIDDDALVTCNVGGIPLNLIIDSGSKCNIIDDKTWESLKKDKIQIQNQIRTSNKTFLAYASNKPLKVLGSFETYIKVGHFGKLATFYVIKG